MAAQAALPRLRFRNRASFPILDKKIFPINQEFAKGGALCRGTFHHRERFAGAGAPERLFLDSIRADRCLRPMAPQKGENPHETAPGFGRPGHHGRLDVHRCGGGFRSGRSCLG
jgi:hypothetical protein